MWRITTGILLTLSLLVAPLAFAGEASEKAAARLLEERMKTQDPEALAVLRAVENRDIVVVAGSMDHIEQILTAASIPHTVISPDQVAGVSLRGDQIVMVNCPGKMPDAGVERLERFVRAGGLLYTTDWTLKNLVEKAFPETIAHNGVGTGNEVTPVQVHNHHDNLMSDLLLRKSNEPHWYLEGGSYPILVVDSERVEVLASSRHMKKQYGAAPVVVRFPWEDGEVIHVVSHFYRQLDTRYSTEAAGEAIDAVSGLTSTQKERFKSSEDGAVNMGDVESSYAFQKMTSNLVVGKARKNEAWREDYRWTPKRKLQEGREFVAPGTRVKVLEQDGDRARIRAEGGQELTVPIRQLMLFSESQGDGEEGSP